MKQKEVVERLITDFGYSEAGAKLIAEKLSNSQPEIQAAIDQWWQQEKMPTVQVAGYSFQRLTHEHNMNPIAAFLTLDWLLRDPEEAVASLQKGHDYVE